MRGFGRTAANHRPRSETKIEADSKQDDTSVHLEEENEAEFAIREQTPATAKNDDNSICRATHFSTARYQKFIDGGGILADTQ